MQLNIQTSTSEMIPITDFPYIYNLAKCSKCQNFILLRSTNKLYGANEEFCCIHEIDVPFLVNTDLIFKADHVDEKNIFGRYTTFFIPDKFNWVILPSVYWDMYIGGDIESFYDASIGQNVLIDKNTKQPIDQLQTRRTIAKEDYSGQTFKNELEGFLKRQRSLGEVHSFTGLENNDDVRYVYDNKVAYGRRLCHLKDDKIDVLFYIFKGLFALAKADKLDVDIRFDKFDRTTFLATFKPIKKRNPLMFNTYGVAFRERIHCMYMNLI